MSTDTIEEPIDFRPRLLKRQALRENRKPRTYSTVEHPRRIEGKWISQIQYFRCRPANGGVELPKQEPTRDRSRYTRHEGEKERSKHAARAGKFWATLPDVGF